MRGVSDPSHERPLHRCSAEDAAFMGSKGAGRGASKLSYCGNELFAGINHEEIDIFSTNFVQVASFAIDFIVVVSDCQRELTTITPLSIITSQDKTRLPVSAAGFFRTGSGNSYRSGVILQMREAVFMKAGEN